METVGEVRREKVHANYCREMACISKNIRKLPPGRAEKRARLEFRLADIKERLIPQLFRVSMAK